MVKEDEIDIGSDNNHKDEIVKKLLSKKSNRATRHLIPNIKVVFTQFRQAFIKVQILQHFNLEYYIWIKIEALAYAIICMLSQFTDLGQLHPVAYYLQIIILA